MAIEFHPLRVAEISRETADAVSIAFTVPPALTTAYAFTPGQHLTLRTLLSGVECRRSYSICSGLDEGELRIAIKGVEGGAFSSWANSDLRVGDVIDVMTPQGRFGLKPDPASQRTIVTVAAGSGITPVISIVRSVLEAETHSRVLLLYGNRTSQDIIFKEVIEDLKDRHLQRFTVHHVLSREQQELPLLYGRLNGDKIATFAAALARPAAIDHAFLCGPGGLIEEGRRALQMLGMRPDRIHVEYFSADGQPVAPAVRPVTVADQKDESVATAQITLNGSVHVLAMRAGETIIDAGIRHGLDMPYSCRGGMCCTCRAMMVDGDVRMDVNYSLEPWEIEAGYVLTCQSHPTTPRVVVDYDQV
jgi:ring-1,2-phenylacetyl-CoA epoxidase subunit PaaE